MIKVRNDEQKKATAKQQQKYRDSKRESMGEAAYLAENAKYERDCYRRKKAIRKPRVESQKPDIICQRIYRAAKKNKEKELAAVATIKATGNNKVTTSTSTAAVTVPKPTRTTYTKNASTANSSRNTNNTNNASTLSAVAAVTTNTSTCTAYNTTCNDEGGAVSTIAAIVPPSLSIRLVHNIKNHTTNTAAVVTNNTNTTATRPSLRSTVNNEPTPLSMKKKRKGKNTGASIISMAKISHKIKSYLGSYWHKK